jgi:hypothetical protein
VVVHASCLVHAVPFASKESKCQIRCACIGCKESHFDIEHIFHVVQTDGAPELDARRPFPAQLRAANLRLHALFIGVEFPGATFSLLLPQTSANTMSIWP